MKIKKIKKLNKTYNQFDFTTETQNFFIASGDKFLLIHNSPSVIAGWSPEDGRFFVGTKSFFNKTPKINYTPEDVDRNHGHSPGLSQKLKLALQYLPKVIKKGNIVQGDFMYSAEDLKSDKIDGENMIIFAPNTLTYAVPKKSPLGKRILNSKIGVIFHTTYSGNTLDSLNGSFKISDNIFNKSSDVYIRTTNATLDSIGWTSEEEKRLRSDLNNLKNTLNSFNKKQINEIANDKKLSLIIRTYINNKVKNGLNKFDNNEIGKLIEFIQTKYQTDINKLKTDKGKQRKYQEMKNFIDNLRNYASTLYYLFKWVYNIQDIKIFIHDKLAQLDSPETPYIKIGNSYQIVDPEGFVISDSPESGVKIVNRSVFSKLNFNMSNF